MAFTNQQGRDRRYPPWARAENLRIIFEYEGPAEVAKQLFGYRWEREAYSLAWLYRRVRAYDRDMAAEYRARGANAACLVWSPGFTIENDRCQWDIVARQIRRFHRRRMNVMVYISLTNAFWKEMFANLPESQAWRQQGPDGEPVPYGGIGYGGREVTRYLMCVMNPRWRAYQKKRIQAAIQAGADGIFWDNNNTKCHCPLCREAFRRFTRDRLGRACDIPRPLTEQDKPAEGDLRSAREVVFDWIPLSHPQARAHLAKNLFRYLCIADILRDLGRYARRLKPNIVWCSNGHLCQHIYDATNLLLSEDLDPVGCDPATGRLRTNAGVLRYVYEENGRGVPCIVNGRHPETYAYGASGYHGADGTMYRFLRANRDVYAEAWSPARVGLVAAEMNYINRRSNWFDNLVRNHILFDVIPVHRMDRFDLSLYDVILLRSILFLSDADCRRLRRFVAGGGTLIATNATSLYDETWARRGDYGLADVFGCSAGEKHLPEKVEHSFGRGRSIFYPGAVELQVEADPAGPAARAIVHDVRRNLRDPLVEVEAPPGVAVNLMRAKAGLVVHVMNYTDRPARNVRIRLTEGALALAGCAASSRSERALAARAASSKAGAVRPARPPALRVLPLDNGAVRATAVRFDGTRLAFALPSVGAYSAVVVGGGRARC